MNERIKELFEKAGANANTIAVLKRATYFDPERFAELIVQECVNVLHDNELWNRHISHALKEHFGVEE